MESINSPTKFAIPVLRGWSAIAVENVARIIIAPNRILYNG